MKKQIVKWSVVLSILIGLILSYCICQQRLFIELPLDGNSMLPTLEGGYVAGVNTSYISEVMVRKNSLIAFRRTENMRSKVLIKRVIAVAGDHLKIEGATVWINGEELKEDYLNEEVWNQGGQDKQPFAYDQVIPEGFVFVMGDNRNESEDSRTLGLIKMETQYVGILVGYLNRPARK